MIKRLPLVALCVALLGPWAAKAHEFWIEPAAHSLQPGDTLEADLRIGQDYSGSAYAFLPGRFVQFSLTGRSGTGDMPGTIGDKPAIKVPGITEGLQVIIYDSVPDRLTFRTFEKFRKYVVSQGNEWTIEAHVQAGLPETGFVEAYKRQAKALVQVGAPSDQDNDRAIGMPLELVALQSPYGLAGGQDELPVQLLWRGAPLAGQQISIFRKGGDDMPSHVTTDQQGRAMIPVDQNGRYMLNAVHMELNVSDPKTAWDSYWASLTFEIAAPE